LSHRTKQRPFVDEGPLNLSLFAHPGSGRSYSIIWKNLPSVLMEGAMTISALWKSRMV
jgi:hypothetical protein